MTKKAVKQSVDIKLGHATYHVEREFVGAASREGVKVLVANELRVERRFCGERSAEEMLRNIIRAHFDTEYTT